jgi:hypothetical protein
MCTDFFVKYNYYAKMLIQWLILVEGILKKTQARQPPPPKTVLRKPELRDN